MLLGLRTIIHPAPELDAAKAAFTKLLGIEPYFDEPFFVGYNVGGYELGLDPNANVADGPVAFWGVADADAALAELESRGGEVVSPVTEVGDGIRVAAVAAPGGGRIGIIENPHFSPGPVGDGSAGPGR